MPGMACRLGISIVLRKLAYRAGRTTIPSDLIVAFTRGTIARKLSENRTLSKWLSWLGGIFLIAPGLRIFLDY
jgi:threonine/homoserine/homoserine lactone efflux protein